MSKIVLGWILLPLLVIEQAGTNLVCKGDFEDFSLAWHNHVDASYEYYFSDSSCWYESGGDKFKVKRRDSGQYSQTCELVILLKYTLCQQVTLLPG